MTILVPGHAPKNVITDQNSKERVGCIWKNNGCTVSTFHISNFDEEC